MASALAEEGNMALYLIERNFAEQVSVNKDIVAGIS
jgi:hypothetical protein